MSSNTFVKKPLVSAILMSIAMQNMASPTGANIVEGDIDINFGEQTVVNQESMQGIIEWQKFDVGAQESVQFIQPNHQAVTVNNIVGGQTSFIDGSLTANGNLIFVNDQGVIFSEGSFVQANGLLVSDQALSQNESGQWILTDYQNSQLVANGVIEVGSGGLSLIGENIVSAGTINSQSQINLLNSQRKLIALDPMGLTYSLVEANHSGAVSNNIDVSGAFNAQQIDIDGENVDLSGDLFADIEIDVSASQKLSVNDANIDAPVINLIAKDIHLIDAQITSQNLQDGGDINIGAKDFTDQLWVEQAVNIHADATINGNGGDVFLWSDLQTIYLGNASANGGSESGDGGFIEVSAKDQLVFRGHAETLAPNGELGTLLLDPKNIIVADGNGGVSADDDILTGGTPGAIAYADGSDTMTISEQALESIAAGTNISLEATESIVINDLSDNELNLNQTGDVIFKVVNTSDVNNGGSASFTMHTSDTINLSGNGDFYLTVTGSAATGSSVDVTLGDIVNGNNIDIRTNFSNNGQDDAGNISVNIGGIHATGTVDIISGFGVLTNGGNSTVTVNSINSGGYARLSSTAKNNSNAVMNISGGIDSGYSDNTDNGIELFVGTGATGNSTIALQGDFKTLGGKIVISDTGAPITNNTLMINGATSFDTGSENINNEVEFYMSGKVIGQSNNITINTGDILANDWSQWSGVESLDVTLAKTIGLGVGASGNIIFNSSIYDSTNSLSIASTSSIDIADGWVLKGNTRVIADVDGDGGGSISAGAITSTGAFDLTLGGGTISTLGAIDTAGGDFTFFATQSDEIVGFNGALGGIGFTNELLAGWTNVGVINFEGAAEYNISNLNSSSRLNFLNGTVSISGTNNLLSLTTDSSSLNINGTLNLTENFVTESVNNGVLTLEGTINSNAGIDISSYESVNLTGSSTISAPDIVLANVNGNGENLTLNIDDDALVDQSSAFENLFNQIGDFTITTTNDDVTLNGALTADSLTVSGVNNWESAADITVLQQADFNVGNWSQIDGTVLTNSTTNAANGIDIVSANDVNVASIDSRVGYVDITALGAANGVGDSADDVIVTSLEQVTISAASGDLQNNITVVASNVTPSDSSILDAVEEVNGQIGDLANQETEKVIEEKNLEQTVQEVSRAKNNIEVQFKQCDPDDENCEKQKAVKSFLSKLLIGGKLPE